MKTYIVPELDIIEVKLEKGIARTLEDQLPDLEDGGVEEW